MDNITSEWSISVLDAMKFVVTDILVKPFQILDSIPLGIYDASVMDFILGMAVISIVSFFFWRSFSGSASSIAGSTMRKDRIAKDRNNFRTGNRGRE